MGGFIPIDRDYIQKVQRELDPYAQAVLLYLISEAAWGEHTKCLTDSRVQIPKGAVATSTREIAKKLGTTQRVVVSKINELIAKQFIARKRLGRNRLYSVTYLSYEYSSDSYPGKNQSYEYSSDSQLGTEVIHNFPIRPIKSNSCDTHNKIKKKGSTTRVVDPDQNDVTDPEQQSLLTTPVSAQTNGSQSSPRTTTTKAETKKGKKAGGARAAHAAEVQRLYDERSGRWTRKAPSQALEAWIGYRAEIGKPMVPTTMKQILKKYGKNDLVMEYFLHCVSTSIENQWIGLRPGDSMKNFDDWLERNNK